MDGDGCCPDVCGYLNDNDCDGQGDENFDMVSPVIESFTLINSGSDVVARYSASDNYELSRAELWRAYDESGAPDAASWQAVSEEPISGTSFTGQISDIPVPGSYWYGLHVVDAAGNCVTQRNLDCVTGVSNGEANIGPIPIVISNNPVCHNEDGDDYDTCNPVDPGDTDGLIADCNDNEYWSNPGLNAVNETCDTLDNDCNGLVDEFCDKDSDGYCDSAYRIYRTNSMCPNTPAGDYMNGYSGDDCNDEDFGIKPGANEICGNGADDNCNGQIDENCDLVPPVIATFDVQPRTTTDTVTITYAATDNVNFGHANAWRTTQIAACPTGTEDECVWTQVDSTEYFTGLSHSGSFTDTPPAGTHFYGIHVEDEAGNMAVEPGPIEVSVNGSEFYVDAINGNDNNNGLSIDNPWRTIIKAKDHIRSINNEMTEDINVYLRAGIYYIDDPIHFTSEDSGKNGYTINYSAYPGENPVISGGREIEGWTIYDQASDIWRAYAGEFNSRQLFVNGRRAIRAKKHILDKNVSYEIQIFPGHEHYPLARTYSAAQRICEENGYGNFNPKDSGNQFSYYAGQVNNWDYNHYAWTTMTAQSIFTVINCFGKTSEMEFFKYLGQDIGWEMGYYIAGNDFDISYANRNNWSDVELVFNVQWKNFRSGVSYVVDDARDGAHYKIVMESPGFGYQQWSPDWEDAWIPDWIENAYEFIDEEGEWFYDESEDYIYYKRRSSDSMPNVYAVYPVLENLFDISGGAQRAGNISFNGLVFSHSTWLRPSSDNGFTELQSNGYWYNPTAPADKNIRFVPGALNIDNSENISFNSCHFEHIGQVGVNIGYNTESIVLDGNTFNDLSGTALQIGVIVDDAVPDFIVPNNIRATNNLIFEAANEYMGGNAIFLGSGRNSVIENNEIRNLPYSGIALETAWSLYFDPLFLTAENNRVSRNLIEDTMQVLYDGGSLYSRTEMPGTEYSYNVITGQHHEYGAIYLDGNLGSGRESAGISIFANILFGNRMSLIAKGYDLVIRDNYWSEDNDNEYGEAVCFFANSACFDAAEYVNSETITFENNSIIDSMDQAPAEIINGAGIIN